MLKACLNGGLTREQHPKVPLTPAELAEDARRCRAAGAQAVHVHPRDAEGRESLAPHDIAAAVDAIRSACPGLPVGVSTGAWIVPDPQARLDAIAAWTTLPDFASVNAHEDGAAEVAHALHARGIGVEAGVWHPEGLEDYLAWTVPCLRILVECMAADGVEALADAARLLAALPSGGPPVLLHAEGPATWPVLRQAAARGLDARIGLEDIQVLPDGSPALDNAALVAAAVEAMTGGPEPVVEAAMPNPTTG